MAVAKHSKGAAYVHPALLQLLLANNSGLECPAGVDPASGVAVLCSADTLSMSQQRGGATGADSQSGSSGGLGTGGQAGIGVLVAVVVACITALAATFIWRRRRQQQETAPGAHASAYVESIGNGTSSRNMGATDSSGLDTSLVSMRAADEPLSVM